MAESRVQLKAASATRIWLFQQLALTVISPVPTLNDFILLLHFLLIITLLFNRFAYFIALHWINASTCVLHLSAWLSTFKCNIFILFYLKKMCAMQCKTFILAHFIALHCIFFLYFIVLHWINESTCMTYTWLYFIILFYFINANTWMAYIWPKFIILLLYFIISLCFSGLTCHLLTWVWGRTICLCEEPLGSSMCAESWIQSRITTRSGFVQRFTAAGEAEVRDYYGTFGGLHSNRLLKSTISCVYQKSHL